MGSKQAELNFFPELKKLNLSVQKLNNSIDVEFVIVKPKTHREKKLEHCDGMMSNTYASVHP